MRELELLPPADGGAAAGRPGGSSGAWLVAALAFWLPLTASARYAYTWVSRTGPMFQVTFMVEDRAIADGIVTAQEIIRPGFFAVAPEGAFTNLAAASALAVDPATGAVLASTNALVAVNSKDAVLISDSGFLVSTSILQSHGRGRWTVTQVADPSYRLSFDGFTGNGQPRLTVVSGPGAPASVTFTLEATTDLAGWRPLSTNQTSGGTATVVDTEVAPGGARFYRVVIHP